MNRNKLKAYAPQARRDFIKAVTDRAAYYGLMKDKIEPITEQGDVAIIAGKPFPRSVAKKRKSLQERVSQQGFEQVMETMAYTWFNRFLAIRFMELHGYLDHGYGVLSHPEGIPTPEILEHAEHLDLPGLDQEKVIELKLEGTREAELYRLLLIAQCNALHRAMPFLFEWIGHATELLLPENLLHSDSVIRKLVNEIPEDEWQEVEIIGWLYQFYISEKKDQVIGKVVKSEDIPAATQLFTPNWIVKYMVQNTLGRQWIATYPNSPLKEKMEYYIEPAEQTAEVQEQLNAITPESLNPEELTLLDPACGSGHILVEAYDLLKAIYQELGYQAKDIPRLILEKNLYGLEIDHRATQLAAFALTMKARADDRKIFENGTQPHVLAIQESKGLDAEKITEALNGPILKTEPPPPETLFEEMEEARAPLFSRKNLSVKGDISKADVAQLIDLFEHGKTFGSLIRVPDKLSEKLPAMAERVKDVLAYGEMFGEAAARVVGLLVEQARILKGKYDAVVANPPYMGAKGMTPLLKEFAKTNYFTSRADLFSMFIERALLLRKKHGVTGFVVPYLWMFLSSFEEFRRMLLSAATLTSLVQLEYNAFEPACVPVCTFTTQGRPISAYSGDFIALSEFKGHHNQAPKTLEAIKDRECKWRFRSSIQDFEMIPGTPVAYWLSNGVRQVFERELPLSSLAAPRVGLQTGDNDRFLRFWYEVNVQNIGFGISSRNQALRSGRKWFPHAKGGNFRRWYGNLEYVVNWQNDGYEVRRCGSEDGGRLKSRPQNVDYYFKPGVTWSDLTISFFAGRFLPRGHVFDTTGPTMFPKQENVIFHLLGYVNSNVFQTFMDVSLQGMHYSNGVIAQMPCNKGILENIEAELPQRLVALSKEDWDEAEKSWEFQRLPLVVRDESCSGIEHSWIQWSQRKQARIRTMQKLEEQINGFFIQAYALQDELSPEVPEEQIVLSRPDREEDIKRLISYAIGCMMGRYSLDKSGLIYAHSGNKGFDHNQYRTFPADDDGIIPITDIDWFEDDAANRVVEFVGLAWPKEHLEENLKFIAEILGHNRGESPRETIRRYLATGFYKHHMTIYKKRPICWLFSSGKQRAFQCLVYLHRYSEGTLSRTRTEYVIPLQRKINARIEQLKDDISATTSGSHRKKLEKERDKLAKQQAELQTFDEKLRHYADQRISLDLDDGVKVNYGKFGDLLAEVKAVTGKEPD